MSQYDLNLVVAAVQDFSFPDHIRRYIARDVERSCVYVIMITDEWLFVQPFNQPASREHIYETLSTAFASLEASPSPWAFEVSAMGRDD